MYLHPHTDRYLGLFSDASDSNKFKLFKGTTVEPTTTVDIGGAGYVAADLQVAGLEATTGVFSTSAAVSGTLPLLYLTNTTGTGKNWRLSSATNGKFFISEEGVVDAITLDHTSGNATFAGTLTVNGVDAIIIPDYILHAGDDSKFGFPSNDNFKVRLAGSDVFTMSTTNATFAGNVSLVDNKKLKLGTGNDLEIYHDGTNSEIKNTANGLLIKTDIFRVLNAAGSEQMLRADNDNAVQLYFNNVVKLATTNTGVSVTGNIIASADVYAEDNIYLTDTGTARGVISLDSSDRDNLNIKAISLGSLMRFYTEDTLALTLDSSQNATFAGNITFGDSHFIGDDASDNLLIQSSANENIIIDSLDDLFFRNSGSTHLTVKSTGFVGIGTTSPSAKFSVLESTANTEYASMGSGSTVARHLKFSGFVANGTNNVGHRLSALNAIALNVAGDDALYINNSLNVGIGTTSPNNDKLHIEFDTSTVYNGNANQTGGLFVNNIYHEALNTFSQIRLGVSGASGASAVRLVAIEPGQARSDFAVVLRDGSNHIERFRIKGETGNVGIGTDSPNSKLHIYTVTGRSFEVDQSTSNVTVLKNDYALELQSGNGYDLKLNANGSSSYGNVTFITNGSERMRVASDGKSTFTTDTGVLIKGASGTANAKLSFLPASGGRQYDLGNVGSDFRIFDSSANVTRMYFDNDGNTGIKTETPGAELDVNGTIRLSRTGVVEGRDYPYTTNLGSGANATATTVSAGGGVQIILDGSDVEDRIRLRTNNTERMRIDTNGNVSIGPSGTKSSGKLYVQGDLIVSGTKFADFSVGSLNTTGYVVATVPSTGNGQSVTLEFTAQGNTNGIHDVIFVCANQGGVWTYYQNDRIASSGIEIVETNGQSSSTLSFSFRSKSGTAGYTPRVMMKGFPYNLVTF